jgi:hypothetical protein
MTDDMVWQVWQPVTVLVMYIVGLLYLLMDR